MKKYLVDYSVETGCLFDGVEGKRRVGGEKIVKSAWLSSKLTSTSFLARDAAPYSKP